MKKNNPNHSSVLSPHTRELYKVICLEALKDENLSLRAKGLHCLLISKPPGWKFNYKNLIKESTDGQTSFSSAIKELKNLGYLKIQAVKNSKGKFFHWKWNITESPKDLPLDNLSLEIEQKPDVDYPDVDYPHLENEHFKYNNKDNRKKQEETSAFPSEKTEVPADFSASGGESQDENSISSSQFLEKETLEPKTDSFPRIMKRSEFQSPNSSISTLPPESTKTETEKFPRNFQELEIPGTPPNGNISSTKDINNKSKNSVLSSAPVLMMQKFIDSYRKTAGPQVYKAEKQAENIILMNWNEIPGTSRHSNKPRKGQSENQTFEAGVKAFTYYILKFSYNEVVEGLKLFSFLLNSPAHRPVQRKQTFSISKLFNLSGYESREKCYMQEILENLNKSDVFRLKGKEVKFINPYEQTKNDREKFLLAFNNACRTPAQNSRILYDEMEDRDFYNLDKSIWIAKQIVENPSESLNIPLKYNYDRVCYHLFRSLFEFYFEERNYDDAVLIEPNYLCTRYTWTKLFSKRVIEDSDGKLKVSFKKEFLKKHLPSSKTFEKDS